MLVGFEDKKFPSVFEDKKFAQSLKFLFVYIVGTNIVTQLTPEIERARASCYVTAPRSHWGNEL